MRPQVAQAALQTSRALCERWYTAYLEVHMLRRSSAVIQCLETCSPFLITACVDFMLASMHAGPNLVGQADTHRKAESLAASRLCHLFRVFKV